LDKINDQEYLKNEQYRTSVNLQARINLHQRFGSNSYPWFRWVFDQLEIQPGQQIVEIGCGPGHLWRKNSNRIPEGARIMLGDLSIGMVGEARDSHQRIDYRFDYLCIDAQSISLPDKSVDLVVANHMLYHVPDIRGAIREIRRVLRPGGRLIAATNGEGHMQDLHDLIHEFDPGRAFLRPDVRSFSLESGPGLLKENFETVETRIYEDHLNVTDGEDLAAYVISMWDIMAGADVSNLYELRGFFEDKLTASQVIKIRKSQGMLIGRFPLR
jgi:SAM-dependent methyltransferase